MARVRSHVKKGHVVFWRYIPINVVSTAELRLSGCGLKGERRCRPHYKRSPDAVVPEQLGVSSLKKRASVDQDYVYGQQP